MPTATWHGKVLAQSEKFETVEGNIYFPPESLRKEFFKESGTTTVCPWKGSAHYYSLNVDGKENPDAAWYYPDPTPAAANIKDHVAFWHGVKVEK